MVTGSEGGVIGFEVGGVGSVMVTGEVSGLATGGAEEEEVGIVMYDRHRDPVVDEIGVGRPKGSLWREEGVFGLLEVLEPEHVGCCGCDHLDTLHDEVEGCGDVFRYGCDNEFRDGGGTRPSSCSRMASLWRSRWKCSLCSCVSLRDEDGGSKLCSIVKKIRRVRLL